MPWAVLSDELKDRIDDAAILAAIREPNPDITTRYHGSAIEKSIENFGGIVKAKLRGYMNLNFSAKVLSSPRVQGIRIPLRIHRGLFRGNS